MTTNNTKILITGAKGQLGTELMYLAERYKQLTFNFLDIDDLDITNESQVDAYVNNYKPDYIINCAAYTAVDRAEEDIENAYRVNAEAPKILAAASSTYDAKLIHVSTDYVFNGKTWKPYNEDCEVNPNSVYGKSKAQGEIAVIESGIGMVIRTSWLYSVYGKNFVKTIAKKLAEEKSLKVVFDQVGTLTWAKDLAQAILHIVLKGKENFIPEVFHYSNEGVCSWYDVAKEIADYIGQSCEIFPILSKDFKTLASRPPYSVLDKYKVKACFDVEVPYWKDSLHKCLDQLKND
ncbi:MAG: dTDP-4-dehydrorhamnose reductase [Bacteroidales bacterium]